MLVKARLYFYFVAQGVGKRNIPWGKVSMLIGDLPTLDKLSLSSRKIVSDRYRYYLLSQSGRGKRRPTDEEIENAQFTVSDDTLLRWFGGQPDKAVKSKKQPYQPSDQVIAAVRDLLIIEGFLTEYELAQGITSLSLAFSLNKFMQQPKQCVDIAIPEFSDCYISYELEDNQLTESLLNFEKVEEAGYTRFHLEVKQLGGLIDKSLEERLDCIAKNTKSVFRDGWISHGLYPSIIQFFEKGSEKDTHERMAIIKPLSFSGSIIKFFDIYSLNSYQFEQRHMMAANNSQALAKYADNNYSAKFEYFEEILYTRKSSISTHFYRQQHSFEELMENENKEESGKALFDQIRAEVNYLFYRGKKADPDASLSFIQQGADVNYECVVRGTSTLHYLAAHNYWDALQEIMKRDDASVNYLVKNQEGKLPSDLAFRGNEELGMQLTEKQMQQANRQGINIPQLLSGFNQPPQIG